MRPPLAARECGPSVSEVPLARLHGVEARSNPAPLAALLVVAIQRLARAFVRTEPVACAGGSRPRSAARVGATSIWRIDPSEAPAATPAPATTKPDCIS